MLVLHGGRIRAIVDGTEAQDPGAERTAIAFADGRVLAVGDDATVLGLATSDAEVVDLAGRTVVPGLIDSHAHPLWGARVTRGVDLDGLTTLEAVQQALRGAVAELDDDEWLIGCNLDYAAFGDRPLHRAALDEVAGERPAFVMCFDLHTALASTAALEAAGVTGARDFDDASTIVVDADGRPTGELREPSAYGIVEAAAPPLSADDLAHRLVDVLDRFAASGLTGAAVMDGDDELVELLERIEVTQDLPVRLDVFLWHRPGDDDDRVARVIELGARAGRRWRVTGVKLFSDGVIDTGTGWLTVPDVHGDGLSGFWPSWDRYAEVVRAYADAGLAITTHACGDGGVRAILDVYEQLPTQATPPRIEHLEVLADTELERVASLGVTASMQPLHMQWRHTDGSDSWAARLGERAALAFRAASLVEAGATVVLGSDWPVATFDPAVGWRWAVTRALGDHVFEPHERLTPAQTLAGYSTIAARALGASDRDELRSGALGDATVLQTDPVETGELSVAGTIVGGTLTWCEE